MSSNKVKLEDFLKENAARGPDGPAWEKQKIWQEIEKQGLAPASNRPTFRRWLLVVGGAAALVAVIGFYQHHQREERINRILYQVIQGEYDAGDTFLW